jgi:hypothetical protein
MLYRGKRSEIHEEEVVLGRGMRITPTNSEDNVILEVEDFGLKVCMVYSSILPSRSLPKVFEKFSGNLVA